MDVSGWLYVWLWKYPFRSTILSLKGRRICWHVCIFWGSKDDWQYYWWIREGVAENIPAKIVTFSLSTPWRHTGEVEAWLHSFLNSMLGGGECQISCPNRLTARGGGSASYWTGDFVCPTASLGVLVKRKILLALESENIPASAWSDSGNSRKQQALAMFRRRFESCTSSILVTSFTVWPILLGQGF